MSEDWDIKWAVRWDSNLLLWVIQRADGKGGICRTKNLVMRGLARSHKEVWEIEGRLVVNGASLIHPERVNCVNATIEGPNPQDQKILVPKIPLQSKILRPN